MAMARRCCYKDALPPAAMVAVEFSLVIKSILYKAASSKGLTYYTYVAYSYALASLCLFPIAIFLIRKAGFPPFKLPIICRICILGLLSFWSQLCTYKGLELGTVTLSSAISNLIPAFTFILAVFFRMEKVALGSFSSQAKIIGTIISISGAFVIVLYKGPQVLSSLHWSSSSVLLEGLIGSPQSDWMIGGLLLTLGYLLVSLWYIVQSQIMKIYPEVIIVNFFHKLIVTILSMMVCLVADSNMSSWTLNPNIVAISILYAGIFGLSFNGIVHTWGVRLKGPVYVAIFRPLSTVIAAVLSSIFLGDALYLGSVIGALILTAGLYAVLWGKAKEEQRTHEDDSLLSNSEHLSSSKAPLL